MRLLIVDDNEVNRVTLAHRLGRRGFDVETVESGEGALAALSARSFDLVLLDVVMPGMSGMDVLRAVRKTQSMSALPIIMATARDGSKDVVEALECGANDYVTKPIDLPVLLARTRTQLELKEASKRISNLVVQLEVRNKFIRGVFGRYLTDEVVETLLATPDGLTLGGESRTVTILMSDLRGFSSLAERLAPPQVVSLLNHYFGAMTEIIIQYGGTIDEFIGDAILVLFGAPVAHPDDATRAVACALAMQLAMKSINERFVRSGLPEIEMGIGINTGEVIVGNIGSEKRSKYGVVGRNVNLASRIEALTVGGQVLISESTREAVGPILRIERSLEVALKGVRDVMCIFAVIGLEGPYGLTLPCTHQALVALREPISIKFVVLDGVSAPARLSPARVTRLSEKEAVMITGDPIAAMSVLRLHFFDGGGEAFFEPAYGKIVGTHEEGGYRVHFTSLPPEVRRLLSTLLQPGGGEE